jgi:hypothetical protein
LAAAFAEGVEMGEVVAFRLRAKSSREPRATPSGDAQILFFLGVRYARMDEPHGACETAAPDRGQGRGHGPSGGKKRKSRARA